MNRLMRLLPPHEREIHKAVVRFIRAPVNLLHRINVMGVRDGQADVWKALIGPFVYSAPGACVQSEAWQPFRAGEWHLKHIAASHNQNIMLRHG